MIMILIHLLQELLEDNSFPVQILVCLTPALDHHELEDYGYDIDANYFIGGRFVNFFFRC